MNRILFAPIFFVCMSVFHAFPAQAQEAVVEKYEYDPLGRLTLVEANNQVKVAYCYDEAGNRKNVIVQGGEGMHDCSDAPAVLPVPPAPTRLSQGTLQGGGRCYINWQAPSDKGIDYFQIKPAGTGGLLRVDGRLRTYSHDGCAEWIRACNAQDKCSDQSKFN